MNVPGKPAFCMVKSEENTPDQIFPQDNNPKKVLQFGNEPI